MQQEHLSHEQLRVTLEYLNYNGPLFSLLPPDLEMENIKGISQTVASAAF